LPESMNKSAIQSTSKKSSYIHPLRSLDNKVDRIWQLPGWLSPSLGNLFLQ
jgi:hypothetical protein